MLVSQSRRDRSARQGVVVPRHNVLQVRLYVGAELGIGHLPEVVLADNASAGVFLAIEVKPALPCFGVRAEEMADTLGGQAGCVERDHPPGRFAGDNPAMGPGTRYRAGIVSIGHERTLAP